MTFQRQPIGDPEEYQGHEIIVRHLGPDVLCEVDGSEIPHFYQNAEAARRAGRRYCDDIEKAKREAS